MKTKTVASLLNPNIAYRLSDEWNWDKKGNAPLSLYIEKFETYGDGLTQHSGSWCAQWADLTDVCASFAKAIVENPLDEAWLILSRIFTRANAETMTFVIGLKYREDKEQYFNLREHKVSSSDSKRHDKRWEKVESWVDGSGANALSVLLRNHNHTDWLAKLCIADDLRAAMGYHVLWEEMFKPTADLSGDWHQAFDAFRSAAEAVRLLDCATRQANNAIHNSKPEPVAETVAA